MSKARAIIVSVTVEGISQSEAAARYRVSSSWVSKLMARYRTEGDAAFHPRSRRPLSSPNRVADVLNQQIVNLRVQLITNDGVDAGPHTIQWHLRQHHQISVSVSTIQRRLVAAALIEPNPKKKPKRSYIRFQAELPNETWQSDFTHIWLADGTDTETISWLDDHSRYALHVSSHRRVTGNIVLNTFNQTIERHGMPASVLTDNGLVYTVRLAGYRGGRNQIETRLGELGITQKHTHPTIPPPPARWNGSPEVHTYDWLVEQIEGSLGSIGSPVFNKHIFRRPENPDEDLFIWKTSSSEVFESMLFRTRLHHQSIAMT